MRDIFGGLYVGDGLINEQNNVFVARLLLINRDIQLSGLVGESSNRNGESRWLGGSGGRRLLTLFTSRSMFWLMAEQHSTAGIATNELRPQKRGTGIL